MPVWSPVKIPNLRILVSFLILLFDALLKQYHVKKKNVYRKVQGVPQSQAAANPRHQEEKKKNRNECKNKQMSCLTTKPTKWSLHPAKILISLDICLVWSVFTVRSLGSWGPKVSSCEQRRLIRWRMPRLIWVFAGCTCHFVGFCHEAAQMHEKHIDQHSSPNKVITMLNRTGKTKKGKVRLGLNMKCPW